MEKPSSTRQILRQESFLEAEINPFIHKIDLTTLEKIRICIMSVTIAPVRFILATLFIVIAWFVALIATIGIDVDAKEPVSSYRRSLFALVRLLGRVVLFCTGVHRVICKGSPSQFQEAPISVMAPHSSIYDTVSVFCRPDSCSPLSRIETARASIFGTLLKTLQPVLVERQDPNSRHKTIEEIRRRAHSGKIWPQMLVFPEGTCTNRKSLINFKAGAFIPGLPVQPVLIRYLNNKDTVTWTVNGPGMFSCLWMSLCEFQIKMEVEYLPVYKPNQDEIDDAKLFARNVRKVMADALGVPVTEHTFEDVRLMYKAQEKQLPLEAGLVEFSKLARKLGISLEDMEGMLTEYAEVCHQTDQGKMSIEEFSKHLKLPITQQLHDLFQLYDRNGTGMIDFREYVIGMSLVSHAAVTEKTVKLAFEVFDTNGDGLITEDELEHILKSAFGMDVNTHEIYHDINKDKSDRITFDEFYEFAKRRPEYAKLFVAFTELEPEENDVILQKLTQRVKPKKITILPDSAKISPLPDHEKSL